MIHKFNCDYCGKYVEDENKTRFCSDVYNDLSGLLYNEYADLQLMESTMND